MPRFDGKEIVRCVVGIVAACKRSAAVSMARFYAALTCPRQIAVTLARRIAAARWSSNLAVQREIERRTTVHLGLRPNATMMALHDPLYRGEADTRARKIAGRVQSLKNAEQVGRVFGIEADAVV